MELVKPIMLTIPLIFELGSMSEPKKKWARVYPKKSGQSSDTFNGGKV